MFIQAIQNCKMLSIRNFTIISQRLRMRSNCAGASIEKLEFSAKVEKGRKVGSKMLQTPEAKVV